MDKMKKNLPLIISMLCCICSVICVFKLSSLERELGEMRNDLDGRINYLRSDLRSVEEGVTRQLSEQANLLTSSDYELGEADYDKRTVQMRYTVVPKEYSPSETRAVLFCGGREYAMELEDGIFTAELPISLMGETEVAAVQLQENGVIRTQRLDTYIAPRQEYLGTVYADYNGSWTVQGKQDNKVTMAYDGAVDISIQHGKQMQGIRSIRLKEYVDGKEVSVRNLRVFPEGEQSEEDNGAETSLYENAGDSQTQLKCAFTETYEVPFGSRFELQSCVTMEDGLEYRNIVQRESFDEKGEPREGVFAADMLWVGLEASIYDSEGKVLYDALEELERQNQGR